MWIDNHTQRIPNGFLQCAGILGILFQLSKFGGVGLLRGLISFIGLIVVLFPLYLGKVLGAGDIKYAAVFGIRYGFNMAMEGMIFSMYFGAVLGLVAAVKAKSLKVKIPFGMAIFCGMITAVCKEGLLK